jgi:hypothetical protein
MSKLKVWVLSTAVGLAGVGGFMSINTPKAFADDGPNPRIHHALDALRDARDEIRDAHHDFHGRKHEAIDAIQHAIDVLDAIKDYDG